MITAKPVEKQHKSIEYEKTSLFRETIERLFAHVGARIGLILLTLIVLSAVFAPLLAPYGYNEMDLLNMYSPPTKEHLLGTDGLGRDLLTRLLYGGRYSLSLGLLTALLGGFISLGFNSQVQQRW